MFNTCNAKHWKKDSIVNLFVMDDFEGSSDGLVVFDRKNILDFTRLLHKKNQYLDGNKLEVSLLRVMETTIFQWHFTRPFWYWRYGGDTLMLMFESQRKLFNLPPMIIWSKSVLMSIVLTPASIINCFIALRMELLRFLKCKQICSLSVCQQALGYI